MQDERVRIQETFAWLTKAKRDLQTAEHVMTALPPLFDDVLFHCQQCVEKTFKALLTWHDLPFRRTHSLEELGEQCSQIDPDLKSLVDAAVPLTEYATRFRYPTELDQPTLEETAEALSIARRAYETISMMLPPETRPTGTEPKRQRS